MTRLLIAILAALVSVTADAQWLKEPTPGLPRTADGSPELTAPAPRTHDGKPDLSGLWRLNADAYTGNVVADLKPEEIQPWADALYKQRMENLGKDDPATFKCLPQGPRAIIGFGWVKIIQTPALIVMLYEDLSYRQIFLDGRKLPVDPNPSFMGYSVGRWEGDTLIVESIGFNDRSWLDFGGHPHSEALRITERFRRPDVGHLELEETFEDATIYARPWTIKVRVDLVTDTELLEYVCNENEKDYEHLVGKASDAKKDAVKVPTDVLAGYVGTYELPSPVDEKLIMQFNITLSGDALFLDLGGKDKQELISLSDTRFIIMGERMEFFRNERNEVTHFIFHAVEGELKATRRPSEVR